MTRLLPFIALYIAALCLYYLAPAWADWRWDAVLIVSAVYGGLVWFVRAVSR